MITYQVEKFMDCYDESIPMLEAHYLEIATDKHIKPLDIDIDKYLAMEEAGMLRIFTVRDQVMTNEQIRIAGPDHHPGVLIGYFVSFVMKHMHYSQTTIALNDIMYLDPDRRGGTVGYRMMKKATDDLKNLGAEVLIIHMKVDYPFRSLLTKLGFHLTEENWEKVL